MSKPWEFSGLVGPCCIRIVAAAAEIERLQTKLDQIQNEPTYKIRQEQAEEIERLQSQLDECRRTLAQSR